ncbi:MAG: cyanophycin synthetase [Bacteroidia bacterium]|nr:UDP-N-acetylmuramate--L-alanine ligase [Bacteroidia bacterium]MDW8016054.1 cyanophycin synthetase [Bacteroidia bacterium]
MGLPERIRLWGIGGVGMSALAQHLHHLGHELTGYDRERSAFTHRLEALGIPIDYEPTPARLKETQAIIYTPAISSEFPEWEEARQRGLPTWRRKEALAHVVEQYEVIAVAGTHGKTTTAAILAWLLTALGESPTAFVGGLMRNFDNNYCHGKGPWSIVEADEYDRALMHLRPVHAILQSIEPDHLEIYGSAGEVVKAYREFASQVRGVLVAAPNVPPLGRSHLSYTLEHYEVNEDLITFAYRWQKGRREVAWHQLGRHFAENAASALVLLEALGYDFSALAEGLRAFKGVARRLEIHSASPHLIVNDYAHHPTEIRRTLSALREAFPSYRLIALFQPHLYSRTLFFAQDFAQALSIADFVLLFPIYAAREPSTPHISSQLISQHLTIPYREVIPLGSDMSWLNITNLHTPSILAFLGAGDIDQWVSPTLQYLTQL